MDTLTTQQDEGAVVAYLLRGKPGNWTELVRMDAATPPAESRELREQNIGTSIGGYRLPARVLPAERWWQHYLHSAVHSACVDAKAMDTVGGEYTIEGDGISDAIIQACDEIIERSLDSLNDAARDWEATGWAALECRPTRGGQLHSLNHLDSWTVWPAKDNAAYIHMRDGKWLAYAPLGVRNAGMYQLAFLNNNHYFKNTYYGVPDTISAVIQIETAYAALEYNRSFFAREGGYRYMMLLSSPLPGMGDTGATGDAKLIQTINHNYAKIGKESDSDLLSISIGNRTATLHRLDSDFKDMDFPTLLSNFRNDILMRHGVPPLRIGIVETGALGGNVGQEQLRGYAENVIQPKQRRWSAFITAILREWVDPRIVFKFNEITMDDLREKGYVVVSQFNNMLWSRREARAELGKADVDGGADLFVDELNPFALSGGSVTDPAMQTQNRTANPFTPQGIDSEEIVMAGDVDMQSPIAPQDQQGVK